MKQCHHYLPVWLIAAFFFCLLYLSFTSQSRFLYYCDRFFVEEMEGNTLTMHYTLSDPENYGIHTSSITLGSFNADLSKQQRALYLKRAYLKTIAKGELSSDQQRLYDLIKYHLKTETDGLKYHLLEDPLVPSIGIQSQLPILFAEYSFKTEADVINYLTLLSCVPEYFQSLITFENSKIEEGLFMDPVTAKELISYCEEFLSSQETHFLADTFKTRLSLLNLTSEKNSYYIEENQKFLDTYVFPSYELLKAFLMKNQNEGQTTDGLFYYPNGTDYYAWLLRSEVGCEKSFEEIEQTLENALQKDARIIASITKNNRKLPSQRNQISFDSSTPGTLTSYLKMRSKKDFPEIPEVSLEIQNVPVSMEPHLSPAFYLVPAIDSWEENIVYLNQGYLSDEISRFTTLAHETYPGHLYQTVYENSTHPHPLSRLLYFGGFTEGWGTYAEQLSYYYAPISEDLATLLSTTRAMTLNIYAHLDLYIHAYGWTETDCMDYLKKFGITQQDAAHKMFLLAKQQPANYLKYYLGYLEICSLKERTIDCLGSDFDLKEFHEFILNVGPAPFEFLDRSLTLWLKGKSQTVGADSLASVCAYI